MEPSGRAAVSVAAIDRQPAAAERARLEAQDAISAVGAQTALARQARALAHELGNLVGVVRGATALITSGVGDSGLWASRIEIAMDGATDLLTRLRAQADPAPDLRPTDLRGPAAVAADLARVRIPQSELRLALPQDPVVVGAEASAVGRAILDLAFALAAAQGPAPMRIEMSLGADGLRLMRPGAAVAELDLPGAELLARAGCRADRETAGVRLSWPAAQAKVLERAG